MFPRLVLGYTLSQLAGYPLTVHWPLLLYDFYVSSFSFDRLGSSMAEPKGENQQPTGVAPLQKVLQEPLQPLQNLG